MGNPVEIHRQRLAGKVLSVTTSETTTPVYDSSKGSLLMAKASGSVTLTVYAGVSESETFLPMLDQEGEALTVALTATQWRVLPFNVFASPLLKFVGSAASTVTIAGKG